MCFRLLSNNFEFLILKSSKMAEVAIDSQLEVVEKKEEETTKTEEEPANEENLSYRLEVKQIPRPLAHYKAFKSCLQKLSIAFRNMKVIGPKGGDEGAHAYLTFSSLVERDQAMEKLNGHILRGKALVVKPVDAAPDPLVRKRQNDRDEQQQQSQNNKKARGRDTLQQDNQFEQLSQEEQFDLISTQVAPLYKMPYEDQLTEVKHKNLVKVLKKVSFEIRRISTNDAFVEQPIDWFSRAKANLEPVVPSPVTVGYRNKFEFNIDAHNNIGFRLGAYRDGSVRVVQPPPSCPLISSDIYDFLQMFAKYLKEKTTLKGFDPIGRQGHWKQMLIRSTRTKEFLISISLQQQDMTEDDITKLSEEICDFFKAELADEEKKAHKLSIYLQLLENRFSNFGTSEPRLIFGPGHIFETLLGVEFRISTRSFFQVNSAAAEVLYQKIIDLVTLGKDEEGMKKTVALDICCGTGTIGLCLAAKSGIDVMGVELNAEAIKDAEYNRQHNQIQGVTFACGRAETETSKLFEILPSNIEDVVAIIDPPRSGLPTALIKTIRNNARISRVIYVSCDAAQAKQNLIDLCRPRSKAYHGLPFVPKRAIPIDMFPHTEGCELVLLFERAGATNVMP